MKIGDKVKLTREAVKNFYGRPERFEDFLVGGELSAIHFCEFVNSILGFDNGKSVGIVTANLGKYIEVTFEGPLSIDFAYYDKKDLRRVK